MAIYTKVGDGGDTYKPGNQRVRKSDPLVEAIGTVDELNSFLGLAVAACRAEDGKIRESLQTIQTELFDLGGMLATLGTAEPRKVCIEEAFVRRMEEWIDAIWARLPELANFILPGGAELAARLHVARTVCRRAERCVVAALDAGQAVPAVVLCYLNRLGDFLFALARQANHDAGGSETIWKGQ